MEDFAPIVKSYCANTNYAESCDDWGICMSDEIGDEYGDLCGDYWGNTDWCGQYDTS